LLIINRYTVVVVVVVVVIWSNCIVEYIIDFVCFV